MSIKKISLNFLLASAVFFPAQAMAADLAPPPPPPMVAPAPPPMDEPAPYIAEDRGSCIYVRADAGYTFHGKPSVSKQAPSATPSLGTHNYSGEKMKDSWTVGGGIGCQATDNVRVDVTFDYHSNSKIKTKTGSEGKMEGKLSSKVLMANAYYDIANIEGFTPYVGAGIGFARNNLKSIKGGDGFGEQKYNGVSDLAWSLYAGASYDVSQDMAVDLGYRYTDLGKAKSEAMAGDDITVKKLRSHSIRLGVRYNIKDW